MSTHNQPKRCPKCQARMIILSGTKLILWQCLNCETVVRDTEKATDNDQDEANNTETAGGAAAGRS